MSEEQPGGIGQPLKADSPPPTGHVAGFIFTGDGGEYFRIWIVNLLLTVLTLGLYSAWAKVRKAKYFRNNTRLDGHVFHFHGRPPAILRGRVLAFFLLAADTWAFQFSNTVGLLPRSVIRATLGEKNVAAYPLPPDISDARTLLVWRRGHQSTALRALQEELTRTKP
jgi:hypothetical protein